MLIRIVPGLRPVFLKNSVFLGWQSGLEQLSMLAVINCQLEGTTVPNKSGLYDACGGHYEYFIVKENIGSVERLDAARSLGGTGSARG